MSKGKKLILADLRVQSFVTELGKKEEIKIKGGCASNNPESCVYPQTKTGYRVCCIES